MDVLRRNNVTVFGQGDRAMVFAHGYGCDLTAWRAVAPAFTDDWRVVLLDHVGFGGSDASAFDPERYDSLGAYADDMPVT